MHALGEAGPHLLARAISHFEEFNIHQTHLDVHHALLDLLTLSTSHGQAGAACGCGRCIHQAPEWDQVLFDGTQANTTLGNHKINLAG